MTNAKSVLTRISFVFGLLFVVGMAIGHYSGFWHRLRIFWYLGSQIPAVQAAMKEYLQEKYQENFEVELPVLWQDRYGCRLATKASPAGNPDLKFDISTDHYRFREPFSFEMLLNKFHESFSQDRWAFRSKDYRRRLEAYYNITATKKNSFHKQPYIMGQNFPSSQELNVYVKSIEGSQQDFKNLDLFKLIEEYPGMKPIHGSEKPLPSVFYETIVYTDQEVNVKEEAERFSIIINEHFLRCKTDRFIIAILYYCQNKKTELELELKERFWMKFVGHNGKNPISQDQENEVASISFRYSHFRDALDADHKNGKLKNAFIISSYDCQGKPISKEQIIKSFLY